MKNLIILGAGTGGTMVANRAMRELPRDWAVTVIDPAGIHLYQPGLLFLPFGAHDEAKDQRPRGATLSPKVNWLRDEVRLVDTAARRIDLANGSPLHYDLLVIATGSHIHPEETEGMAGPWWGETVHDFYTLEGALRLRSALENFRGGRLVVDVVEMPIKCPVAPMEFLFLADEYFLRRGLRKDVELVYATPLDGAFTKPTCSRQLSYLLERKEIRLETLFNAASVDGRAIRSWDDREVPYDLLVSIPTHKGAAFLGASGLGNELDFVPTERHTLRAKKHEDVFVLGDATDLPSSKAGSVAHFQSEVLVANLLRTIRGEALEEGFDGHANCFIESGFGKALLIDFNYDVEPLPGHFPIPGIGPLTLLGESRFNHWGKLAFRPVYWNALLPGRPLPVSTRMSMRGKHTLKTLQTAV
ncbi:MAG TPA: FAD-dependent oxidoreductase [Thermoanaerobaculia bacterium]|nr:FAD-dependent oxidoreductase [Thermoanaerobaculia bacterium]